MARTIFSSLRAQAKNFWHCVVSNTALQPPPRTCTTPPSSPPGTYTTPPSSPPPPPPPSYATSSLSFFSCPSSSPATTPSSSLERQHHPSSQLTTGLVRPPHHHCPANDRGDSASSSSFDATAPHAPTTTELQQEDSRNQSYEYPPPFNQILVEPGLGKVLLGADLATLLTMVVLLDKNESLELWGRVVCLLLLLSSLAMFFALLLKELYPVIAMVTALLGIGCSIAAICAYPLSVFLTHFWVTVLSPVVALSVMTLIMIIFCLKRHKQEEY